jgi:hypothetical protein
MVTLNLINAQCSTPEFNVDFNQGDISTVSVINYDACCASCFANGACTSFTYNTVASASNCYLKAAGIRRNNKFGGE